jgi:hypothetical protein
MIENGRLNRQDIRYGERGPMPTPAKVLPPLDVCRFHLFCALDFVALWRFTHHVVDSDLVSCKAVIVEVPGTIAGDRSGLSVLNLPLPGFSEGTSERSSSLLTPLCPAPLIWLRSAVLQRRILQCL